LQKSIEAMCGGRDVIAMGGEQHGETLTNDRFVVCNQDSMVLAHGDDL
jgi:hypothetical protein